MTHRALLLVDLQNDFCAGGALAVPEGDSTVDIANQLIAWCQTRGDAVLASQTGTLRTTELRQSASGRTLQPWSTRRLAANLLARSLRAEYGRRGVSSVAEPQGNRGRFS